MTNAKCASNSVLGWEGKLLKYRRSVGEDVLAGGESRLEFGDGGFAEKVMRDAGDM